MFLPCSVVAFEIEPGPELLPRAGSATTAATPLRPDRGYLPRSDTSAGATPRRAGTTLHSHTPDRAGRCRRQWPPSSSAAPVSGNEHDYARKSTRYCQYRQSGALSVRSLPVPHASPPVQSSRPPAAFPWVRPRCPDGSVPPGPLLLSFHLRLEQFAVFPCPLLSAPPARPSRHDYPMESASGQDERRRRRRSTPASFAVVPSPLYTFSLLFFAFHKRARAARIFYGTTISYNMPLAQCSTLLKTPLGHVMLSGSGA